MLQTRYPSTGRHMPPPGRRPNQAPAGSVVPFDLAARFALTGEPGRLVQDVLTIGPDAAFTPVAISYAFEEDRRRPVYLQPRRDGAGVRAAAIQSDIPLG